MRVPSPSVVLPGVDLAVACKCSGADSAIDPTGLRPDDWIRLELAGETLDVRAARLTCLRDLPTARGISPARR